LLESAYDVCLAAELSVRGLSVERQKSLPVIYKDQRLDCGYRLDFVVEGAVVLEIKAVERLERVHSVQLLSYLRFAKCPLGLLFNFHAGFLTRDGLKRVVNVLSNYYSAIFAISVFDTSPCSLSPPKLTERWPRISVLHRSEI
jgi:GxxExxY protein